MTEVAQKINKATTLGVQVAKGTPISAGVLLRRVSFAPDKKKDTFDNQEVVSHQQSTGISYGVAKGSFKYSDVLSPGTHQKIFENVMRSSFASVSAFAAGTDVTAQAAGPQFVDASAGYITGGLKVGHVGKWTGFAGSPGSGNNSREFLITALTAGNMTGVFLDGNPALADAAGDDVTFTVTGKCLTVPLTGHTNVWLGIEDWYADISRSECLNDCKFSKIDLKLPANANATIDADGKYLTRTLAASRVVASPTAETTTPVLNGTNGAVIVSGTAYAFTECSLSIDGMVDYADAEIGSKTPDSLTRDTIKVTGSFSGLFRDTTIQAFYDAETPIGIICLVKDSAVSISPFQVYTLSCIKISDDAPDDGKNTKRTYPFTAEIDVNGGAATASDKTILRIQDSAAT